MEPPASSPESLDFVDSGVDEVTEAVETLLPASVDTDHVKFAQAVRALMVGGVPLGITESRMLVAEMLRLRHELTELGSVEIKAKKQLEAVTERLGMEKSRRAKEAADARSVHVDHVSLVSERLI